MAKSTRSSGPAAAVAAPTVHWPLPWLTATWARLWAAERDGRLGHALLFAGPAGIGKRLLADRLAHALLCSAPGADGAPCGVCAECRLLAAGSHPDLVRLVPDPGAKSREIKADQVRSLCEHQALTPHRGARKVLQIVPAEAMNPTAANGLLKTLEEPVGSTLWLLVSEDPTRLAATIRSRCQRIDLPAPPAAVALPWLAAQPGVAPERTGTDPALLLRLAHGAPLAALAINDPERLAGRRAALAGLLAVARGEQDPLALADAWQGQDPAVVLDGLAGWVCDLLRLAADPRVAHLDNPDQRDALAALAPGIAPVAGHRYLGHVLRARALAEATINKQLLFEGLLVRWARLARGAGRDGR